eukprot:c21624_g1_i2.p1 GENE.c21624_g1_i2~~c21624_g1_i2.p1  ORF type:complete len:379 (-),score=112.99 c21624_g1_i2:125-1201(-)
MKKTIDAPGKGNKSIELFLSRYEFIVNSCLSSIPVANLSSQAQERLKRLLDYTVLGGKMTRGLTVAESLKASIAPRLPTEEEIFHCHILGWCLEILQAAFLVADDIMDNAKTRRNKPCWNQVENMGKQAYNDAFILESFVYLLLKQHCRQCKWYIDVFELFHHVCLKTEVGQMLDLWVENQNDLHCPKDRYKNYTFDLYNQIVENKTAYYSFTLPVLLGMYVAGTVTEKSTTETAQICSQLGLYFQIQDDYLDCYGDSETIGKIGTDIQEGKCSWVFLTALKKANETQKGKLYENYALENTEAIKIVKTIYDELNVQSDFKQESEKHFAEISSIINESTEVSKPVFTFLLNRIHDRSK